MKLAKSLLLGSATAFVAVAGANAADLPSKKAAPVNYVKVCDAYGAGFYTIPGTDTCIKVGGRVRADYAFVPKQDIYTQATGAPLTWGKTGTSGPDYTKTVFDPSSSAGKAAAGLQQTGWETRGRVDMDARTATAYGTVQTVFSTRLARTTGSLANASGADSSGASPTLEAAYIRFAGFTFGVARDNFAYMPSRFYGAGHWGSFANGAKQIAYTAALGGGFSATIALQDPVDTTLGGFDYTSIQSTSNKNSFGTRGPVDENIPQVNARIDLEQGWGNLSLAGAARYIHSASTSRDNVQTSTGFYIKDPVSGDNGIYDRFNVNKTAYALGLGTKFNLPMIASGDALWLTAAWARGMTEYTTNWSSFKSSAYKRDVGGFQLNHPSYVYTGSSYTGATAPGISLVDSWNVAGVFDHYWAPQWRQSFLASYGKVKAPSAAKNCANGIDLSVNGAGGAASTSATSTAINGCFGDAQVWNVGSQVAFLPTKDFEIGVELLYANTKYNAPDGGWGLKTTDKIFGSSCYANAAGDSKATCSSHNVTGRLRVERTF